MHASHLMTLMILCLADQLLLLVPFWPFGLIDWVLCLGAHALLFWLTDLPMDCY
jgi:hypothetical protein